MTIYERIKYLRIKNGMSQDDLAKKVGYVGRSAISKVESGERDISQSMIDKYADALGVTPTYLLFGDSEEERVSPVKQELLTLLQTLTEEEATVIRSVIAGLREHKK